MPNSQTYLHKQLERLDSDALEIIMCSMYGCQNAAFDVLKARCEMVLTFPLGEPEESTNTETCSVRNVEAYSRKRNTDTNI